MQIGLKHSDVGKRTKFKRRLRVVVETVGLKVAVSLLNAGSLGLNCERRVQGTGDLKLKF